MNIIKVQSDIVHIKIGKTLYYIDFFDYNDIKVYDENLKRLCVFIPEYWIAEVSRGKLTLSSLYCTVSGYKLGYNDAIKNKSKDMFVDFFKILSDTITNTKKATEFIKLCWIELYPYQHVKSSILKLLSDRSLYTKDLNYTTNVLCRFIPRAKFNNDKEIIDQIELIIIEHDLMIINYDLCSIFTDYFIDENIKDQITININNLVDLRHANIGTNTN